jgi:hypothetical protein
MFLTAHAVRLLLTPLEDQGFNPGQVLPLQRQIPWAIIPFLLTVGICRLARMTHWPEPKGWLSTATARAVWERTLDGATLGILMFIAYGGGLIIHDVFNIPLPVALQNDPYNPVVYTPTVLFGFLIGCVAVRDARRAGLATIIDHAGSSDAGVETNPEPATWRRPLSEQTAE